MGTAFGCSRKISKITILWGAKSSPTNAVMIPCRKQEECQTKNIQTMIFQSLKKVVVFTVPNVVVICLVQEPTKTGRSQGTVTGMNNGCVILSFINQKMMNI